MLQIKSVENGSIAQELELAAGDKILAINNKKVQDVLDFCAFESKSKLKILVEKQNGEAELLSVKKDPMEGLGVELEENFEIRECCNNCIFCFINQLPKGLRKTLYVKDDDFRMSFSNGNYVTLTNANKKDLKRIEKLRLSPLYVSVHAVTPRIRNSMLCNHNAGNIVKIIKRLSKKIDIHAQIVLVPGFNDGEELKKTLIAIVPYVKSVAVVPVGLTKFRAKLPRLRPVNQQEAAETIDAIDTMRELCQKYFGSHKVFAADEFYILADRDFPDVDYYEDFAQIENGVGMITKLKAEFDDAITNCKPPKTNREVSIATGLHAFQTIKSLCVLLQHKYKNVKVYVYPIVNNFFGTTVTATGLLTGGDLIEQLEGKPLGTNLLLSSTMLREGTDTFLDNTHVTQVEKALNTKIVVVENTGEGLINSILGN